MHGGRDLQVMSRNALVVDDAGLPPGGEHLPTRLDRPPHPTRSAEVVTRPGVIGTDAAAGRCDQAFESPDLIRNLEVRLGQESATARSDRSCIQAWQRVQSRRPDKPDRHPARPPRRRPCTWGDALGDLAATRPRWPGTRPSPRRRSPRDRRRRRGSHGKRARTARGRRHLAGRARPQLECAETVQARRKRHLRPSRLRSRPSMSAGPLIPSGLTVWASPVKKPCRTVAGVGVALLGAFVDLPNRGHLAPVGSPRQALAGTRPVPRAPPPSAWPARRRPRRCSVGIRSKDHPDMSAAVTR